MGGLSRYLLLTAAIDVGVNSNDIRPFLDALDRQLQEQGRGLFDLGADDAGLVLSTIDREQRFGRLLGWQAKREVPRILAETNTFVHERAAGDFDGWAREFSSPGDIVQELARAIYYQGRGAAETRKKM